MNKMTRILLVCILVLYSCEKENNNVQEYDYSILKITKNSLPYREFKYTDLKMVYMKDYSESDFNEWSFEYNSFNKLINIYEYNEREELIKRYNIEYNEDGLISTLIVYILKNGEESLVEEKKFQYDNESRLKKIEAYFPETFVYNGLDIIKHGKVSNQGIWVDYQYFYDNKKNLLSKIGMPAICATYINEHNIDSVVANWTEYIDNLGIDSIESIINHNDFVYSSTFEYNENENENPKIEYRNYTNNVDTFEYIYK